jgi:mono/diheme cytochrome c family protein
VFRPLLVATFLTASTALAAPVDFAHEVRPIFEKHCFECHGPEKQKSGFRLDHKPEALAGGDEHAPDIVPGKSGDSPLYHFITGDDPKLVMPPKGKGDPLSAEEIAVIKQWLDQGALWPNDQSQPLFADRLSWWSFQPLTRPIIPSIREAKATIRNPIDSFVVAQLREKHYLQSPEADPRTLIRRVYYDLLGLPPTPKEVDAFVAAPDHDRAYEKLVDRLLSSPRYGERWARHWLDVVHYGETHGYDKDKPRLNSWPYRDYVIRAFNEDIPYARFVQEQLSGDVLFPGTVDGIVALGFIAAGPWDYIGHAEVPESKTDGQIARHLDRDDMVQNTLGTFCSLTVGCAQCHNHKFDPITQEDYYSLQAVFAAVDRTDIPYYAGDEATRRAQELQKQRKVLTAEIKALESPLQAKVGGKLLALDRRIAGAADKKSPTNPNAHPDYGYHSAISKMQDAVKWVQVDLGQSVTIDRVVLLPCYDDFNGIGAGFGFPVRFKLEVSDDPEFKTDVTLLWRQHDQTFMNDFKNPGLTPFVSGSAKDDGTKGRYLRVTATKLAPRKNDFIFALAELQVFDESGANVALHRPVMAMDSIEAAPRWRRSNLTDGLFPEARTQEDKDQLIRERDALLLSMADGTTRTRLADLKRQSATVDAALAQVKPAGRVYAGAIHTGTGAFRGTGPDGGLPRVIHVLKRGDIKSPGREVGPASIKALSEQDHLAIEFPNAPVEGERRAALAQWITSSNNPLTWRSIVNRVWQHHFGRPLVDTPNDFGRMGALPANQPLLDYLAVIFRDDLHGSLKSLHKLILMSHTYRQSSEVPGAHTLDSAFRTPNAEDSNNTFLWRQNRTKLDAESLHDTVLLLGDKLDLSMGGPSFQDFVITHPEHSPHYEYDKYDPEDPKSHRRSIYRFIVRSQQQPFMTCLDCADPSMRVDKRNESLSALQALALLNDGFMVSMAKHFAERVERECTTLPGQITRAFELALSRAPTNEERVALTSYAKENGLANACRLILNLNEFSFVD